jgi:hypothetical protein
VDIESVRDNERIKAIGVYLDNASLALFAASIAKALHDKGLDLWSALGLLFGVVFFWAAWHIRDLIESED